MFNKTLALALFGLVAFSGAGASAQTDPDQVSMKVSYGDLNIQSPDGAKVLLRRIENAAHAICAGQGSNTMDRMRRLKPCVREVVERTAAEVNSPALHELAGVSSTLVLARQSTGE